jgi:hypothetical protein
VVVVPEICRHEAGNVSCSTPDVVVLSEYVPSDLAVHFPVTLREPVTAADVQPIPSTEMSI